MERFPTLRAYLETWAGDDVHREAVAETVQALAEASRTIAKIIAAGPLAQVPDSVHAQAIEAEVGVNADGDEQKELDVIANEIVVDALWSAPVSYVLSEELENPTAIRAFEPLYVAIDPLDGSSNIDTNVSIGTIFSVLPMVRPVEGGKAPDLLQPGANQLAAGYVIYGPQTALVLTVGAGTQIFTLDPNSDEFHLTGRDVSVKPTTSEFAINASNFRHWDRHIKAYVDDCLEGEGGPRTKNYNMRWVASLVAEAHRILSRGGVFLYPGDTRDNYSSGRLRLIYEANPIAFLMQQADAAATTGWQDILQITPKSVHERVPLIFGSKNEVARIDRYYAELHPIGERSPLFNQRGLFRS